MEGPGKDHKPKQVIHGNLSPIDWSTIDGVRSSGFVGFLEVETLVKTLDTVPNAAGVYLVVHDRSSQLRVLPRNPGGMFKGRNPTLPVEKLEGRWQDKSPVLYIGKAGPDRSTLRSRLKDCELVQ